MHEIELPGVDGGNLLGYLTALGTLRVLSRAEDGVKMSWAERGRWVPAIHHPSIGCREELLKVLEQWVCGEATINPSWEIGNDLTLSSTEFGEQLKRFACESGPSDREVAAFLAAFGCSGYGTGPKKETMADTEFRTMSGAGHQHFLGFMRELAARTEVGHLRRTLFDIWDYEDDRPSLRWDPADFRPHALRAVDPSRDAIKTMRGANRLAIEALPLFPTVPLGKKVRTAGFAESEFGTEFTWPVWVERLSLREAGSLIASDYAGRTRTELSRRGVGQVFRARRFTEGKFRNFSPARPLL